MHPSIIPALARLRQDIAEVLTPETIRDACRHAGHSWRNRTLGPVATLSLFLLQVLHGNTACQHVVQFGQWTFSATAYCKARKRLPLAVLQALVEMVAAKLRSTTAESARKTPSEIWAGAGRSSQPEDWSRKRSVMGSPLDAGRERGLEDSLAPSWRRLRRRGALSPRAP